MARVFLGLLDVTLAVESAAPEALAGLTRALAGSAGAGAGREHSRAIPVRLIPRGATALRVDTPGGSCEAHGEDLCSAGAAAMFPLFELVCRQALRRHVLVHAGAVDLGRGAVAIVGRSGAGKTTLALALALRGARFLSDETAPLERATGAVVPLPRALGLRAGTRELLPALRVPPGAALRVRDADGSFKEVIDPVDLGLRIASGGGPLRHILFLGGGAGVNGRIDEVAPTTGLLRITRFVLNGASSALLEGEHQGSASRLVFELAGVLRGARYWDLEAGALARSVRAIEALP